MTTTSPSWVLTGSRSSRILGRAVSLSVQVLLEIHNTHAVSQLFVRMRAAVLHGQLPAMRSELADRR